jgi:hypothetical protein
MLLFSQIMSRPSCLVLSLVICANVSPCVLGKTCPLLRDTWLEGLIPDARPHDVEGDGMADGFENGGITRWLS